MKTNEELDIYCKDKITEGLNPKQVEAVTHTQGPLLILAGAGSGKTTVLTRRVAYLIACGVRPSSIIAITFTNKAAKELKNRINDLLGDAGEYIWAMTFHAACARILRIELPSIGRSGSFSISDSRDQLSLMKQILKDLNLSDKQYPPRGILRTISSAKDNMTGPAEYQRKALTFYETKVAQAYSMYQNKLREMDSMDFDDLIMETVLLFKEHPQILNKYQEKFQYIHVDEYQDTNRAQYELIRLLVSSHRNIAVVGDDDQSIYTFRGADIRNILEFEKDYTDCKVVKLEQNYRSTQTILDGAYHVVSKNINRKDKRLWTSKKEGPKIVVYAGLDPYSEAKYAAQKILDMNSQDASLASIAVLYRTHAQSRAFEEVFMEAGIPYEIVGGLRFYQRKEIKDAICYLRLLAYPKDYLALERVANEPARSLGPASVRKLVSYALENQMSIIDALCCAKDVNGLNRVQKETASQLGELLKEMAGKSNTVPLHTIMWDILERSGYKQQLEAEGTPESIARLENLDELLSSMKLFSEAGGSLNEYLEQNALVTDQDTYDEQKDACVLMTLHAAKGLEFKAVFLVGMEEGLMPHARSIGDEIQMEEERRLCYVGMTRAKEYLYLTFAANRQNYTGPSQSQVSRFIADIPFESLDIRTWQDD